jgi:hypothetical protein
VANIQQQWALISPRLAQPKISLSVFRGLFGVAGLWRRLEALELCQLGGYSAATESAALCNIVAIWGLG